MLKKKAINKIIAFYLELLLPINNSRKSLLLDLLHRLSFIIIILITN